MKPSRIDQIRQVASEWEFDKRIPAPRAARLLRELLHRVDELERGMGQMRLISGLPLPPEVVAKVAEADRLRKSTPSSTTELSTASGLDAFFGKWPGDETDEQLAKALVESYQRSSMDAEERLRAVRKLLEENGCECPCDHHWEERGPECEVCLACLVGEAVGK